MQVQELAGFTSAQELLSSYRSEDTRVLLVVPFDDQATMDDGVRLTGSAKEVGKHSSDLSSQLHTCQFGHCRMRFIRQQYRALLSFHFCIVNR